MFGNSKDITVGDNSTAITQISSGYKLSMPGGGNLKKTIHNAMSIDPDATSEENINKWSRVAGELKSSNAVFRRESKARLDAGRAALNLRNSAWQHVQGAAGLEQQLQASEARNIQAFSEKMLDIHSNQNQHAGFISNLDIAKQHLDF